MAPKRQRPGKEIASSSSAANFDSERFVSEYTYSRYKNTVEKQTKPIPERGFALPPNRYPWFDQMVVARRWQTFVQQPGPANIKIVREFYANAYACVRDYNVLVRGKSVSFAPASINKLFSLRNYDNDEYSRRAEQMDLEWVISKTCIPGAQWVLARSGKPRAMEAKNLTPEARVWFQFLTRRLLPGAHISTVSLNRMILLATLMAGESIDVGRVIASNIMVIAKHSVGNHPYPSIIMALCERYKVVFDPSEGMQKPKGPITPTVIEQCMADGGGSQPLAPPRVRALPQRIELLEHRMAHVAICNEGFEQMMRALAKGLQLDMAQFPRNPTFTEFMAQQGAAGVGSSGAGASGAEEEGEEGEDHEENDGSEEAATSEDE